MRTVRVFAAVVALAAAGVLFADRLHTLKKEYRTNLREGDLPAAAETARKIGSLNTAPAAVFLLGEAEDKNLPATVYDGVLEGVSRLTSAAAQQIIARKGKSARWQLKVSLARAVAETPGEPMLKMLLAFLSDRHDPVVRQAVESLGTRGDPKAVDALIELLEKEEKDRGLTWEATVLALKRLTNCDTDILDAVDWRNWWTARGKKPVEAKKSEPDKERTKDDKLHKFRTSLPKFFGKEILSKRVIFVLDVSGSMLEGTPPRIDRVKRELTKVVDRLPAHTLFNIIAFNDKLHIWQKRMKKATAGAKRSAKKFVKSFSAEAQTHTDEALRAAFAEKGVDTIYLLSDGAPYKLEHGSSVSVKFIQDIIAWVAKENRFRKVKIHTFGFEEVAEEEGGEVLVQFLKTLAAQSGGKFTNIK